MSIHRDRYTLVYSDGDTAITGNLTNTLRVLYNANSIIRKSWKKYLTTPEEYASRILSKTSMLFKQAKRKKDNPTPNTIKVYLLNLDDIQHDNYFVFVTKVNKSQAVIL